MKRTFLGVVAIVIAGFIFVLSPSAQGQVVGPSQQLQQLPAGPLPDLVVSKVAFTTIPTIADPIMINVEIMNQGNAAAFIPAGKTLWLATKPSGGAVGPASKGVTIGPGSFFSYSFGLFMAGELKPGIYDIKVTVDPENSVRELNKINNLLSGGLVVFQNNWRSLYPTLINLATELQRDYSQQKDPQYSPCGDYASRSSSALTLIRERMTAAEAFLNKKPIDSQAAGSAAGNLGVHMQNVEHLMEEFTNKISPLVRVNYPTMTFENFDQKSNQLFTILASVLKSMKDMQAGIIRNMN